jgi:hypothetical protein
MCIHFDVAFEPGGILVRRDERARRWVLRQLDLLEQRRCGRESTDSASASSLPAVQPVSSRPLEGQS